tara:strand:- start:570 stop:1706 length:1137 start_codon:yes stop_codon:yes gene_type:complete
MYVLDCGKNASVLYNSELDTNADNQPPSPESCEELKNSDVLNLHKVLPRGSQLRCEDPHLGCPRRRRSKAQPWHDYELLEFYNNLEEAGIELRLTSAKSTPRAQNRSKLPKSDENDAKSIYLLLRDYPEIKLKKPAPSFELSKKRSESYEWVDESNLILNNQRGDDYDTGNPLYEFLVTHANEILENPLIEDAFTKDGCARYKSNNKNREAHQQKGHININQLKLAQIYAVLCQLINDEGELRFREETQQLAGWKFIKRFGIKMSPHHFKGGVARSNLYFHGLRHWVAKKATEELGVRRHKAFKDIKRGGYFEKKNGVPTGKYIEPMTHEEEQAYLKYRRQYCKAVKLLFIKCKEILEREYNLLETNNGVQKLIPALA